MPEETREEIAARVHREYHDVDDVRARLDEIHERAEGRSLAASEQHEWDALAHLVERYTEAEQLAVRGVFDRGGLDDRAYGSGSELRDQAMRHLDVHVGRGGCSAAAAERVEALMGHAHGPERSLAQRWAAAAGDPAYETAFAKLIMDPVRGHMTWTTAEQRAYAQVQGIAHEFRAPLAKAAGTGAELIPLTLDPTIMLTDAATLGTMRANSRVVTTSSGQWQGVSSSGATAEWLAEATEAADGSPPLDDVPIPVYKAAVDVIWSYEVQSDSAGAFLEEIRRIARDKVTTLTETAYTTGSGTAQPTGIVTALAGTTSEINGGGTEAVAAGDAYLLQNALPARFSANASFMSHIAIANTFRQFETTNGALAFPELRGTPPMLLGKPWHENNHLDSVINAAATENNYVLVYGDFKQFVIVDQVGSMFEVLPGYGANRRPSGQRHGFLTFRTGSDVADGATNPAAFRLLDVPTTA